MLRSRRFMLAALGGAALTLAAGAAWRAEAQGGGGRVTIRLIRLEPRRVASGGSAGLEVRVTGSSITGVTAQTRPAQGGNPGAGPVATLLDPEGDGTFSGNLNAPNHSGRGNARVSVRVTAHRSSGSPVNQTVGQLTVTPGTDDPGPPPPPPI